MKKIILLYFICSFSIYAQGRNFLANEKTNGTSTIDSLFSSVNKQLSGYPSECIYLQTSKGIYEAGEDLWFKAYQLDVQTFGLSDKSKTLYRQMINPNDWLPSRDPQALSRKDWLPSPRTSVRNRSQTGKRERS